MKSTLTILISLMSLGTSFAQGNAEKTDVTAEFVTNASFEGNTESTLSQVTNAADGLRGWTLDQPTGWTYSGTRVTNLLVTKDCYADNNFGLITTIPDQTHAYYLRMGWSTGTTTLAQTVNNLPAGKYLFTIDQRTGYANSATSNFVLSAASEQLSESFVAGSANCFTTMNWTTSSLPFELAADGNVELKIAVNWQSGGSCIMMDNVRLYKLSDNYIEEPDPTETDVESFTEGIITSDFVAEAQMKDDLLQMLANFATYMKNDFQNCAAPNSINEECGCFKGENTMGNNEQGVRPNADLSMICAFLVKYGKDKVTLPANVTWNDLETMAMKSLVFAYSTHKANKLKVCAGGNYWGSVSNADHVWESSLWAMSVAYSAYFQREKLSEAQKNYIYQLLKAECNYELERSIPTGFAGDTKAEENGWEADILAATLGLYPNDELAPRWFNRLREFAINSYSHFSDADNTTVIDPDYDNKTIADLYKGKNLYDDYTLQNHNLFHTSYQNVVMQELGEAALALKLFQLGVNGEEKWKTNALMHHNQEVMDEVLNWLALADGELAMPNGNDWSLFLYDQITSYTTQACFQRDANALMLENMAYKYIQARQKTTTDGSWLLRADVGARRMGVEAHRVMMTWLMHEILPTADMTPTAWADFNKQYAEAKILKSQNIVRAATDSRFTCFSWSTGLNSYTGYIAANSPDKNKIIVPYRANNTGNFLGWYEVSGKNTNATPVVSGIYQLKGNSYVMNGELNTNDGALNNRFALYSTPGNAVIYLDYVRANADATITAEKGGLMAISVDEFTKSQRTLYYGNTSAEVQTIVHKQLDGCKFTTLSSPWVNIDNELGIITGGGKSIAFGDRANNNSINTAKLYPLYSGQSRSVKANELVDSRYVVYFSNTTAEKTKEISEYVFPLSDRVPAGWNGLLLSDSEGSMVFDSPFYLLLSNFTSDQPCTITDFFTVIGQPVFSTETTISKKGSTATFVAEQNHSVVNTVKFFLTCIDGGGITAIQDADNPDIIYIRNDVKGSNKIGILAFHQGQTIMQQYTLTTYIVKVSIVGGELQVEEADGFPVSAEEDLTRGYKEVTDEVLNNPNFETDETYGNANGNVTLGSTTYNPCYVNDVQASDSSYPNILPVQGWTAGNQLASGSNFARMYSMPYSTSMYCVSPSNVGNYAARCARPVKDSTVGERCLTVLNSWTSGTNRISQTVSLPKGTYRLLFDMKYECTNEHSNDGQRVVASGNTNTSVTGIRFADTEDFRYPTERNSWQQMCYDFVLDDVTDVEISLGFTTSSSVGAANNTLLYIDNLRLFVAEDDLPDAIRQLQADTDASIYDLSGRKLNPNHIGKGIYIKGNKKMVRN